MPSGVYPRPYPALPPYRRGGSVYIPLSGKNGRGLRAIVSRRDFRLVRAFRWFVSYTKARTLYAQTHVKRVGRDTTIQMHRLILPHAHEVDHRNGNGLDNRRRNLRAASSAGNRQNRTLQRNNTSGYRGVRYNKQTDSWMACIGAGQHKGKRNIYLGLFKTAKAGALVYDRQARRRFGSFARLNFPRRGERSVRS